MSQKVLTQSRFHGGISNSEKEGTKHSYKFGRSIDYRSDPSKLKILPKTIKDSNGVVIDLPLWATTVGSDDYFYGDAGNIYKLSSGSYTDLRTVANSHGNGLEYFPEDDYLYYTLDKVIGRYGPITGTPAFNDNFLGQSDTPTNTYSIDLERGSSQYGAIVDASQTGLDLSTDFSFETWIKLESLPSVAGGNYSIISKDTTADRSYDFGIKTAGEDSNTKLLLHMDGADGSTTFTDSSASPHTFTANGNAQIDTAQYKFGTASGLFDGTGDYIDTPDSADFALGSNNFTIDCRFKINGGAGTDRCLIGQVDSTAANANVGVQLALRATNKIQGRICSAANEYNVDSTTTFTDTDWHHAQFVRDGNTLRLFIDGVEEDTQDVTGITANNSTYKLAVGRLGEYNGWYWDGWIDEVRIVNGVCKTTKAFTVPTGAYQTEDSLYAKFYDSSGNLTEAYMGYPITASDLSTWIHVAVTADISASSFLFYKNSTLMPTIIERDVATSIKNSAADFAVGARDNAAYDQFFDGRLDDLRVWSDIRTSGEISTNYQMEIGSSEAGLVACYKFSSGVTDETANNNDLTASGTPTYVTDVPFAGAASGTSRNDIDQYLETSGNTYTPPITISEAATARQTFVPSKDPQKSIEILVAGAGSGDWTVTVHDSQNNVLATKTIANASMVVGDNEFTFSSVWRPIIGKSYHFHVTSTVADGTVTTTTNADLETVDFHAYYQFLVEDTLHPVANFLNFQVIGNERYIAKWDGLTYNPHKVVLPAGYRVSCFSRFGDYIAIGTRRGTNITDFEKGRIFFWDGVSSSFNSELDVPEGGINAMVSKQGVLYYWAGTGAEMFKYSGVAQKIRRMPKMTDATYCEITPGSVTVWRSLIRFGLAFNSDNTSIEKGVYTWGTTDPQYTESLSYDYPISTGTRTGATLKIGCVHAKGLNLYIGWQDGSNYGIDKVTTTNDPFSTATIELLMFDNDSPYKVKKAVGVRADSASLNSGESYTIKYKKDRASGWNADTKVVNTANDTNGSLSINSDDIRFNELEVALDLATSVSTSPTITGIALVFDNNEEEKQILTE